MGTLLTFLCCGLVSPFAQAACDGMAGATVRWIVPNKPGGGYDAHSRLIQPLLEHALGATIFIENRSEAGGIVGAAAIRDAVPDGRTLGIINASGLLAAAVDRDAPNPATDFSILARVATNQSVLLTGAGSGIQSLEELLGVSGRRPIVVGVRDAGSASVFAVPTIASLIGMEYALVTGYVGNTARVLAAMRGEVDVILQNFDSVRRFVQAGELRPLLQAGRIASSDALLLNVPTLEYAITRRSTSVGSSIEAMRKQARALDALVGAGRVVVGPSGMAPDLLLCLQSVMDGVLTDPELVLAASRMKLNVVPADAAQARADIATAMESMGEFAPLVRAAMQRARN